jgi:hypothetical protein
LLFSLLLLAYWAKVLMLQVIPVLAVNLLFLLTCSWCGIKTLNPFLWDYPPATGPFLGYSSPNVFSHVWGENWLMDWKEENIFCIGICTYRYLFKRQWLQSLQRRKDCTCPVYASLRHKVLSVPALLPLCWFIFSGMCMFLFIILRFGGLVQKKL